MSRPHLDVLYARKSFHEERIFFVSCVKRQNSVVKELFAGQFLIYLHITQKN
jgi:hypothetical protein